MLLKNYQKLFISFVSSISILSVTNSSFAQNTHLIAENTTDNIATNTFLGTSEFNINDFILSEQNKKFRSQNNIEIDLSSLDLNAIINFGKLAWQVIQSNKPVVNLQTDIATALPENISDWAMLSEWHTPIANNFAFEWTLLSANVVKFNYSIIYTPGGTLNGTGRYIANVMLVPTKVKVFWGYTLNSTIEVMRVLNIGTEENPIAGLELRLKLNLDSAVAHHERSAVFYMTGDGKFQQIAFY